MIWLEPAYFLNSTNSRLLYLTKNATLLFYIGMLVALKEEAVLGFARKFYVVLLPVCLVAFVALYKATVYMLTTYSYWSEFFNPPGYLDKFRCLSCQLPMVIVFMFIVLLLMLKIRFSNGVLKFLGEISLELYLIHNLFLIAFRTPGRIMIRGTFSYVIAVLLCSLVLAFLLHQLDQHTSGLGILSECWGSWRTGFL